MQLVGATRNDAGACAQGAEVWYVIAVAARTVLYFDTLGSTFDTRLSIRAGCALATLQCEDDDCGVAQDQLVRTVPVGTYFIGVHAASSATTTGTIVLNWQTLPGPRGTSTRITGNGQTAGTTPPMGAIGTVTSPACDADGREDLLYFTLCSGDMHTVTASTCLGATWDTVLVLRNGLGVEEECNDDVNTLACNTQSSLSVPISGPGIFGLYIDGWGPSDGGPYVVTVGGL
jgi:hypothetical protein